MSRILIEECRGHWREILMAVGIPEICLTGKPTACPSCGGKDRFRFDDKDGSGSWYCNQCPRRSGYGIHLPQLVFGWDYRTTCQAIERVKANVSTENSPEIGDRAPRAEPPDDCERAKATWKASSVITPNSAAGRYLKRRGLALSDFPADLRQNARLMYFEDGEFEGWSPAMVALVRGPDGKPVTVHKTYLTASGDKADVPAPRKFASKMVDAAAVRLASHGETLGIAEGVETALSATALFDVPCWAAINSANLAKWSPPPEVREVIVFGDNDTNFTGHAAAYELARRLAQTRLKVRVEIPSSSGDDWNDVLTRRGAI